MHPIIRVLYLLHDSRRSGVPAVAVNAIRESAGMGVKPTVCFAYDGVYAEELRASGIKVDTIGPRRPFIWRLNRFFMNLKLLCLRGDIDVVHVHSIKLIWSVLFAKMLGFRVVFHLHEMPRNIGLLLRYAISTADAVVFCSETCSAHFAEVPARIKRTIVNAMHFNDSLPPLPDQSKQRIVMVGSINKNKGQDLLLQAFTMLQDKEAELWFYGTTGLSAHKYVHDLKQFAKEHGVADRVFFPGPTSDVFSVFAQVAVVVHTSWTESFGMALVEAQSSGVPVIAHNLEGMREVVIDGETGFLIEPGNVGKLADRLDILLADAGMRAGMGAAGYRMVRERFSIKARIPEYRALYQEVCRP